LDAKLDLLLDGLFNEQCSSIRVAFQEDAFTLLTDWCSIGLVSDPRPVMWQAPQRSAYGFGLVLSGNMSKAELFVDQSPRGYFLEKQERNLAFPTVVVDFTVSFTHASSPSNPSPKGFFKTLLGMGIVS
jgi:hypothetical protein